jgi:hypothetical protein
MRRLRGLLIILSFVVFLAVAIICIGSVLAERSVTWFNSTEEPVTTEAREYARQNGAFDANLVGRTESYSVTSFRGKVALAHYLRRDVMSRWDEEFQQKYVNHPQWSHNSRPAAEARLAWSGGGLWGRLGFKWEVAHPPRRFDEVMREVTFPIWPIAVLIAIPPLMWLRRLRRLRYRTRRGLCLACGYDLRGSAERCPECGAEVVRLQSERGAKEPTCH